MDDLTPGTCILHVGMQLGTETITGPYTTQRAMKYKPLCTPDEVLIRRDSFTAHSMPNKYYYEPAGHLIYDPKEIGGSLAHYENRRIELKLYEIPAGVLLKRCDDCMYELDPMRYPLWLLAETEL